MSGCVQAPIVGHRKIPQRAECPALARALREEGVGQSGATRRGEEFLTDFIGALLNADCAYEVDGRMRIEAIR